MSKSTKVVHVGKQRYDAFKSGKNLLNAKIKEVEGVEVGDAIELREYNRADDCETSRWTLTRVAEVGKANSGHIELRLEELGLEVQ